MAIEGVGIEEGTAVVELNARIGLAQYGEVVARLVALIVAQEISQLVRAFLVEVDDAPVEVGMKDGQSHALLAIGLHIPNTRTPPMQVVAPVVNLWLAGDGYAVDISTEHLAPIYQQTGVADAVVVVGSLGVVVSPKCEAYPAPSRELAAERPCGVLSFGVGLSETEHLLVEASVEDPLVALRYSHEGVSLRGYGVGNEMSKLLHGVSHDPCAGVVQLQMQMRSCGVSCVAADGYQVTCPDRQLAFGIVEIEGVAPARALEEILVGFGKPLQVAVDASHAVGMVDIYGIAESVLVDRDARDIAISDGEYLLALHIARLDIQSTMEVPGARLAKVTCQHDIVVYGRAVFNDGLLAASFGGLASTRC